MTIQTYSRHRCADTHTSILSYVGCAFPQAHITGAGKFALITRCGVTGIHLHKTEDAAAQAKADLDTTTCPGNCRAEHQIVQLSPNPEHNNRKRETR